MVRSILSEFNTFSHNKAKGDIEYHYVDDTRVFNFVEELYALPNNNPITTFETSSDITRYLREQWAGLFQRFVQEQRLRQEMSVLEGMQATVTTLNQLVTFLTQERRNKDVAIQDILLSNHPAFETMKKAIRVPYRLYFTNRSEMEAYLKARAWKPVATELWDKKDFEEWWHEGDDPEHMLILTIWTGLSMRLGSLGFTPHRSGNQSSSE